MSNTVGFGKDEKFNHLVKKAEQLLAQSDYNRGASICVDLAKHFPDKAMSWHLLSRVSLCLGRLNMAVDAALHAIERSDNNVTDYAQLARCYLAAHEWKQAGKALELACRLESANDADNLSELGSLLYESNQLSAALTTLDQALAIDDKHIASLYNRAAIRRFCGHTAASEQDYLKLLELRPDDFEACHNLLQLKRRRPDDNIMSMIDRCLALNATSWQAKVQLGYAKAKYYEDIAAHELAFAEYQDAASIKRQHINYDLEQDLKLMDSLPGVFKAQGLLADNRVGKKFTQTGSTGPAPIFVLGLPRSGTTLVERIIGSHSQVISGGELNSLPLALMEAVGLNCLADPFRVAVDRWLSVTPGQLHQIRHRYLQLSADRISAPISRQHFMNKQYFVDKLPFNFLFCGHILKTFPDAKIIHVERDPLDAVFSNFKMLFKHGYGYSYDLHDSANYIVAYRQMMQQWHQLFPGKIHNVQYEQLVNDSEAQIDALMAYCGLNAEMACFEFYNNPEASQTASASQVRQPIYQHAVGNWRHYLAQLSPVIELFADAGMDISRYKAIS